MNEQRKPVQCRPVPPDAYFYHQSERYQVELQSRFMFFNRKVSELKKCTDVDSDPMALCHYEWARNVAHGNVFLLGNRSPLVEFVSDVLQKAIDRVVRRAYRPKSRHDWKNYFSHYVLCLRPPVHSEWNPCGSTAFRKQFVLTTTVR